MEKTEKPIPTYSADPKGRKTSPFPLISRKKYKFFRRADSRLSAKVIQQEGWGACRLGKSVAANKKRHRDGNISYIFPKIYVEMLWAGLDLLLYF